MIDFQLKKRPVVGFWICLQNPPFSDLEIWNRTCKNNHPLCYQCYSKMNCLVPIFFHWLKIEICSSTRGLVAYALGVELIWLNKIRHPLLPFCHKVLLLEDSNDALALTRSRSPWVEIWFMEAWFHWPIKSGRRLSDGQKCLIFHLFWGQWNPQLWNDSTCRVNPLLIQIKLSENHHSTSIYTFSLYSTAVAPNSKRSDIPQQACWHMATILFLNFDM